MPSPSNVDELKSSGWTSRSVKDELRENLLARLKDNSEIFPSIVGYEKTVIPQIVNAILARHDFILLGLRGQAKTKLLRLLPSLLDEKSPSLKGCALRDDPLNPTSPAGKKIIAELGGKAPIEWMSRDERYREKLATPDVSMGDLLGDIDPIKASRDKLDLSDEGVIHWGIIPRSNRGIFAVNEVSDLPPRIQVGLLNLLEENDLQIRGFPLRLPMDLLLVFTANPEDYTRRGNLITPLKDRIASQILTHYPSSSAQAVKITDLQAKPGLALSLPDWYCEAIELIAFEARSSEYVDPSSGVSARLPIAAREAVLANIEKRQVLLNEKSPSVRLCDLAAAVSAVTGKIELVHTGEDRGGSSVALHLIGRAIKRIFDKKFPAPSRHERGLEGPEAGFDHPENYSEKRKQRSEKKPDAFAPITRFFADGGEVKISDLSSYSEYLRELESVPGLEDSAEKYFSGNAADLHLRMELVLEGLHQHGSISKNADDDRLVYADRMSRMLKNLGKD